jgi:hypothetical protein
MSPPPPADAASAVPAFIFTASRDALICGYRFEPARAGVPIATLEQAEAGLGRADPAGGFTGCT